MIRIVVAEDNHIVRKGIAGLLNEQLDMQVVAYAENGLQALELLKKTQTDILLADINMPGMDGLTLTERVSSNYPQIKVIILTMHQRADFIQRAFHAGAKGYLLKDGDFDELYMGIRKVFAGEICRSAALG